MQVIRDKQTWDRIVKSFMKWDIYYLYDYAVSLEQHGDGAPCLLYFETDKCRMCYVLMINDISHSKSFRGYLEDNLLFDAETPYGYGGPMIEGDFDKITKEQFKKELFCFCRSKSIVTQFIRFNPVLQNHSFFSEFCEVSTYKETIFIDTTDKDIIIKNMDPKNRNMIRKAKKMGVNIISDQGERLEEFKDIYNSTMKYLNADNYYYFNDNYYCYIKDNLKDNIKIFYSIFENKVIGTSIFFYNNNFMHYHLSGTLHEYRSYASTNLLIYEAAKWSSDNGISVLHLGGGTNSNDSLFKFKKKFNMRGHLPFYIGRSVFNKEQYDMLLQIRKQTDPNFDLNNSYFIQYRR